MILREFPAGAANRGVVRVYRVVHFVNHAGSSELVKIYMPNPEHCLWFFVGEPDTAEYPDGRTTRFPSALSGLHDMALTRRLPSREFFLVQVALEPSGLHRLTGIPAQELRNQCFDLADVLGAGVRRVLEQMAEAGSYAQLVGVVDGFIAGLAERGRPARPFDGALQRLLRQQDVSMAWLADQSALSMRQFERRCREQLGMGPKLFSRLARFNRAFNFKVSQPARDWLTVATQCGYSDYQHMVRDFRDFTGLTPPAAVATQDRSPERVLGVPQEFNLTVPEA